MRITSLSLVLAFVCGCSAASLVAQEVTTHNQSKPAAPQQPASPTTAPAKPGTSTTAAPGEPAAATGATTAPQTLGAAIDRLGTLDFGVRMQASRTVRRAPAAQAVPALMNAVAKHKDSYVRFRALVLLAGFGDPQVHVV